MENGGTSLAIRAVETFVSVEYFGLSSELSCLCESTQLPAFFAGTLFHYSAVELRATQRELGAVALGRMAYRNHGALPFWRGIHARKQARHEEWR